MDKRILGTSGIEVAPIVFGGNVFGWTIDEKTSFDILDAFIDHGFNAIDTADCYSAWAPGNTGGESETIIGNWLKARPGMRDKVKIFTKVGSVGGGPTEGGLSEKHILEGVDASLTRLGIEQIDLYFSHWPDPAGTSTEETLGAFEKLIRAGKVKVIGASNVNADQLQAALDVAHKHNLPAYQVVEPEYNLFDRYSFDGALRELCVKESIGVITYYSLASGFLSGKYRSKDDLGQSKRGEGIAKYLTPRGMKILEALDIVAKNRNAKQAEIALAWLLHRKGVSAPIASATKVSHVESFAKAANLHLGTDEMGLLDKASL